jgi:type 1 glutamine amidotransferase
MLDRRSFVKKTGLAALLLGGTRLPAVLAAPAPREEGAKKRLLVYTRSQTFQHSVVTRPKGGGLSLAERVVTDLGQKHNIEVVCEKDGRVFLSKDFPTFDGFLFETTGDLTAERATDGSPPMPVEGKKALLDAVAEGKGFVGSHCASDTFHSPAFGKGGQWKTQGRDDVDPYLAMLGGEFIRHGEQQKAWMRVVDHDFPGANGLKDFELLEEWYSLKNFAPDLHVILVQETKGMRNVDYDRPSFPATWARKHHKGRVFYTSMGHREDVWENPIFQTLLAGALAWTLGRVDADVTPNLDKVAPHANELPDPSKKPNKKN